MPRRHTRAEPTGSHRTLHRPARPSLQPDHRWTKEERSVFNADRYSFDGHPYVELIEATVNPLHSPALGEGIHHVGFSDSDVHALCTRFANSSGDVTTVFGDDAYRITCAFAGPQLMHGIRAEVVD